MRATIHFSAGSRRDQALRALIVALVLLLAACGPTGIPRRSGQAVATPDTLPAEMSYNLGTEPIVLDPLFATDRASLDVVTQLFDGLTYLDPETAQPQPALAEEWDVSTDGRTYTFRLRTGASWVNQQGERQGDVTAEDVVYAIRRACRPETVVPAQTLLFIIQECERIASVEGIPDLESVGVRAVERYIVEFQLVSPAAYFPAVLALPLTFPVPAGILEQQGEAWSQWPDILTNGPFRVAEWTPGEALHLVPNDVHHRAAENGIARIVGRQMEAGSALEAFRGGTLDALRVSAEMAPLVEQDARLYAQVRRVPDQCFVGYGFTLIKGPVDSRRVRQALTTALDRERLAQLLNDRAVPARHVAPPLVFGVPGAQVAIVEDDVPLAQSLLAAAGYPQGQGLPPVTLAFPDTAEDSAVATAASQMWRDNLGIEVALQPVPVDQYIASIARTVPPNEMPHLWLLRWCGALPDEHAWISAIFSLPDEFASDLFPSDPRDTILARTNPLRRVAGDIDLLLEEAVVEADPATRQQLYAEAESLALEEEAHLIPLYHTTSNWLLQPWVTSTAQNQAGPLLERWRVDMMSRPGVPSGPP